MANTCGDCTACCTMLPVAAIDKPVNTRCQHVCSTGCAIYQDRPTTCAEFECAYLQAKSIPTSLRPDQCGIIFIKRTKRIFSGVLVPGVKITDQAKGQIDAFAAQGFSVVLFSVDEQKQLLSLAQGHSADDVMGELRGNL